MIKGFTTVKFAIGCILVYIALYNLYLIMTRWNNQQQSLSKLVSFIFLLVAIGVMIFLESHVAIKQFLLGAGRYNEIRSISQPEAVTDARRKFQLNIQPPKDQSDKTKSPHTHSKSKIQESFQQANLLKFSLRRKSKELSDSFERRPHRSLSLSFTEFEDDTNLALIQRKKRNQELHQLTKLYLKSLTNNKKDQAVEQQKINYAKHTIANIFQKQAKKQLLNIEELKQTLERMFEIDIVDLKMNQSFTTNESLPINMDYRNKVRLGKDIQVTLDEVLKNYSEGLLWKCGYKLRNKPAQDQKYREKLKKEIDQIISQRRTIDRAINMKQIFDKHSDRINAIEQINNVQRSLLENLISNQLKAFEEYEMKYRFAWVLTNHINELVRHYVDQAVIFMEKYSIEPDRKYYIRWLLAETEIMTHFRIVIQKIENGNETREQIECKPGEDNIFSLFANYLQHIKLNFKHHLGPAPLLLQYIEEVSR